MRIGTAIILFAVALSLLGCAGGPSQEQQDREEAAEAEAMQKSEAFARSLPPAR